MAYIIGKRHLTGNLQGHITHEVTDIQFNLNQVHTSITGHQYRIVTVDQIPDDEPERTAAILNMYRQIAKNRKSV